jgi:hypothetical protein
MLVTAAPSGRKECFIANDTIGSEYVRHNSAFITRSTDFDIEFRRTPGLFWSREGCPSCAKLLDQLIDARVEARCGKN